MKAGRNIRLSVLLLLSVVVLAGCKQKADETKAIGEIEAEVEKMSTDSDT